MPIAPALTRESSEVADSSRASQARRHAGARPAQPSPYSETHRPSDDEILGLNSAATENDSSAGAGFKPAPTDLADGDSTAEPAELRAALDANPELRRAWDDAQSYRETFATPEEARAATALLADLDRMDALFFSRRPEDHAELARAIAALDPGAFASLAQAMNGLATEAQSHRENSAGNQSVSTLPRQTGPVGAGFKPAPTDENRRQDALRASGQAGATQTAAPTQAQAEFFHAANAAAVEGVLDAIESQVERLLPEGVSKSARNRVVGEIYRELDTTLRSNRQLSQQMRDAFRSGSLDAEHQRAIVSLITGRARQALPGVAKRVLNEWTSTIVAANTDRRTRQRAAERRVDIAGSSGGGNDSSRSMTPRDIDYSRLSDGDILNL